MTRSAARNAAREARRRRALGPGAACAFCGHRALVVLKKVSEGVAEYVLLVCSALEEHHVVGRAHDRDWVVVLCLNCHAIVTACQTEGDVFMPTGKDLVERLARARRGFAAHHRGAAMVFEREATELDALGQFLNEEVPDWPERFDQWRRGRV